MTAVFSKEQSEQSRPADQPKLRIDDGVASILSILSNRESRRRFFKKNRNKILDGMSWQDVNSDSRIVKQQPFINVAKRARSRG